MQTRTYKEYLTPNSTFAVQAALLQFFLKLISPDSKLISRHYHLLNEHHSIDIQRMGFVPIWHKDKLWGLIPKDYCGKNLT